MWLVAKNANDPDVMKKRFIAMGQYREYAKNYKGTVERIPGTAGKWLVIDRNLFADSGQQETRVKFAADCDNMVAYLFKQ